MARVHEERDLVALVMKTTRLIAARRSSDVVMRPDRAQVRIGDSIFGRRLQGEFDFDLDEQK